MLKKAKNIGLVESLVQQFQDAIVSGEYQPGYKFPPSREMEKILGASRGTLREAFRILEHKGLIEIKVGVKGGVFVRQANTEPMADSLSLLLQRMDISIEELADFRIAVEARLVSRVLEKATPLEIAELEKYIPALEECAQTGGSQGWVDLLKIEVKVRKTLIRLARSRIFEAVLLPIHENLFNYTDHYLPGGDGLAQEAFEDWQIIIKALLAGDEATAVGRTKDHIRRFGVHLEKGRLRVRSKPAENPQDSRAV